MCSFFKWFKSWLKFSVSVDLDTICLSLGHPEYIQIFLQVHTEVEGLKFSSHQAGPMYTWKFTSQEHCLDANYSDILQK
jgi:hypothetical protein